MSTAAAPAKSGPLGVIVCEVPVYKPWDAPPVGYLEWHEWVRVQYRAGLRQMRMPCCGRWLFPQEQCTCAAERGEGEEKEG